MYVEQRLREFTLAAFRDFLVNCSIDSSPVPCPSAIVEKLSTISSSQCAFF